MGEGTKYRVIDGRGSERLRDLVSGLVKMGECASEGRTEGGRDHRCQEAIECVSERLMD